MSTQLESVRSFVSGRAPVHAGFPITSQVIVVGSGKGGVGTSTVSSLLALVLAERGDPVLLVDATDGHGSQPLLLGVEVPHGLDALRDPAPSNPIVPVTPTLSLVTTAVARSDAPGQSAERRALFRRLRPEFVGYRSVVIDGGSRLDSVLAACEAGVGMLLAVTAADRISLAATYALVKALGIRLGDRPVAILGNRTSEAAAREAAELVDSATRRFLERSVEYAGALPDDACLAAGIAAGMPVQDAAAGSPAAVAMQDIAEALLSNLFPSVLDRPGPSPSSRR